MAPVAPAVGVEVRPSVIIPFHKLNQSINQSQTRLQIKTYLRKICASHHFYGQIKMAQGQELTDFSSFLLSSFAFLAAVCFVIDSIRLSILGRHSFRQLPSFL